MEGFEYIVYKIGTMCQHELPTNTNHVDVVCVNKQNTYHRVSQVGKMCNKCVTIIMSAVNSVDYCVCCENQLDHLVKNAWICMHQNRDFDEI